MDFNFSEDQVSLRDAVARGTELGKRAKAAMDAGAVTFVQPSVTKVGGIGEWLIVHGDQNAQRPG